MGRLSAPLVSVLQESKNIEIASKKINSQSIFSKAIDSMFFVEVEEIIGVTFRSFGAITSDE